MAFYAPRTTRKHKVVFYEPCTFRVAIALDNARKTQSLDTEMLKYFSVQEKNSYYRIAERELKLHKQLVPVVDVFEDIEYEDEF